MRVKKWLAFMLAAVMLLTLCACGEDKKPSEPKEKDENNTTKASDVLQNIIEDNVSIDDKFTDDERNEIHVNTELPTTDQGITNIALFGLDERGETGETVDATGKDKSFHADAVMILTIDRRADKEPTIKLSSIARDTLVYVEGYNSKDSKTKLCNAFDYGYRKAKNADSNKTQTKEDYKREGAKTALKTLNYNFKLNITDYVYMNFVEFIDIIDYIGGVTIDVQQRELLELNKHIRSTEKECGRDLDTVSEAGEQKLNGGQALAYCRIRKIDSDLKRTQRCRTVMKALFDEAKDIPINQLSEVISKLLGMCHTTLTADEILDIGTWAMTKDPEILNLTMPDTDTEYGYSWIWEGTHADYGWVWIYDLDYASALLIDFIFDEDTAKDVPRPTMPDEPRVTATQSK